MAEAFLAFLRSDEGQKILADYGFRPLDPRLDGPTDRAPAARELFTHRPTSGGWSKVNKEVYGPGGRLGLAVHRQGQPTGGEGR